MCLWLIKQGVPTSAAFIFKRQGTVFTGLLLYKLFNTQSAFSFCIIYCLLHIQFTAFKKLAAKINLLR